MWHMGTSPGESHAYCSQGVGWASLQIKTVWMEKKIHDCDRTTLEMRSLSAQDCDNA
jgi:hypothetical protein